MSEGTRQIASVPPRNMLTSPRRHLNGTPSPYRVFARRYEHRDNTQASRPLDDISMAHNHIPKPLPEGISIEDTGISRPLNSIPMVHNPLTVYLLEGISIELILKSHVSPTASQWPTIPFPSLRSKA